METIEHIEQRICGDWCFSVKLGMIGSLDNGVCFRSNMEYTQMGGFWKCHFNGVQWRFNEDTSLIYKHLGSNSTFQGISPPI